MVRKVLSWNTVYKYCGFIVNQLKDQIPGIEKYEILGLSRGGLIPAVIISNLLNIRRVYSLGLQSYSDQKQDHFEVYQIPELSTFKNVLVIDDIADTGNSFYAIKEMITNCNLVFTPLILKKKCKFLPKASGKIVSSETWVVFPWE